MTTYCYTCGKPLIGGQYEDGCTYREHVHDLGIIAPIGARVLLVSQAVVRESRPGVFGYTTTERAIYDAEKFQIIPRDPTKGM